MAGNQILLIFILNTIQQPLLYQLSFFLEISLEQSYRKLFKYHMKHHILVNTITRSVFRVNLAFSSVFSGEDVFLKKEDTSTKEKLYYSPKMK